VQKAEKYKPFTFFLALLFLLVLLSGLGLRFWAGEQAMRFTGPTHIAAGNGNIYLSASKNIFEFSPTGELIRIIPPHVSGLNDEPIDMRVGESGTLLIAEQRPAKIRICDLLSWQCRSLADPEISRIEKQFKVLSLPDPDSLLLTDARGDTLLKWAGKNNRFSQVIPKGTLAGPNDIAKGDGAAVWVADTDHRRILELLPIENGTYTPGREHSAVNDLTIGERYYPMMLVRASDERWWVAQAAEFSEAWSDLVIYHPDEGVQNVVELPDGAYATDLVAIDDRVLVSDLEQFAVYQVQVDTLEVTDFGDEAFQKQMRELRERRDYYIHLGTLSLLAIIIGAVLMVLAAIRATPGNKRWTPVTKAFDWANVPQQVPPVNGIYWLKKSPKMDRNLKIAGIGLFTLVVLVVLVSLVLFAWVAVQAGPDEGGVASPEFREFGFLILLHALALGLLIPVTQFAVRPLKRKLGTDGKKVFIGFPDGRTLAADPAGLAYTGRLVFYKKFTLPLFSGRQQPVYIAGEVETWLAPLLRNSTKLTEAQALKHQWKLWTRLGRTV